MTINVNCPPRGLFIGRETENVSRTLTVDFSAWAAEHGPGTLQVLLQRPGDTAPYPVTLTVDGTVATWKPSETDLAEAGTGAVQLVYTTAAGVREKTQIIPVMVEPSLGVESDPPEGWTSWLDQLTDLAAETEQHAASAAESAGNAAASATGAQRSATDAENAKTAAVAAAEAAAASVSHYPQIVNGVWYVWSPTAGEYISTGIDAQGEDGVSPTVEITAIQGGHRVVITDADGPHTFDVLDGVTPDMSAYRTAADQDEIDDAQDEELNHLKSAINAKAGILRDTVSGSVASFVPDSTVPNLLGVSVDIEPVQAGSGDPSPDNVRPISGRESVEVEAAGKNLWSKTLIYGNVEITDLLKPGETYTASGKIIDTSRQTYLYLCAGENAETTLGYIIVGYREPSFTFTVESGVRYWLYSNASYTNIADVQIELGSTATSYKPFAGNTYTIQLGDTVYGGTLDVTAGTLTVDRAMVTFDGTQSDFGVTVLSDYSQVGWSGYINVGVANDVFVSDTFQTGTLNNSGLYKVYPSVVPRMFFGLPTNITNRDEAKAWFADHPAQVVYHLAAPIVIQLDPVAIATIANQTNNVWADAGDVSVEFAADLKTYIDQKIAAAVAAMS